MSGLTSDLGKKDENRSGLLDGRRGQVVQVAGRPASLASRTPKLSVPMVTLSQLVAADAGPTMSEELPRAHVKDIRLAVTQIPPSFMPA